jgi:hypothetical protein
MRVVAVSMVKNEAGVVEPFVRHAAAVVDHHLIFDHASTDGTLFVLRKLVREGLPLTVVTDDRVGKLQAERTTALMRRAAAEFAADWVLPLDADEFPQPGPPAAFRAALAGLAADRPAWVWMVDHAPHPADDPAEPNPVLRLRHRVPDADRSAGKVIVPGRLAADPRVTLGYGNHTLLRDGAELPTDRLADLWLAHFPAYSPAQTILKVATNELQRRAAGRAAYGDTHYARHFRRLLSAPGVYLRDAGSYLRGEVFAPAAYWGGPLRYPPPLGDWERAAAGLLAFAGGLADSHGRLADAARPPGRLARAWRRLTASRAEPIGFRDPFAGLPDSRSADGLGGELTVEAAADEPAGLRLRVRARNTGGCVWRRRTPDVVGTVNLGVQLYAPDRRPADRDFHRAGLPADVEPGDEVRLDVRCPRPAVPGAVLRLDLVSEGVGWFNLPWCEVPVGDPVRAAA